MNMYAEELISRDEMIMLLEELFPRSHQVGRNACRNANRNADGNACIYARETRACYAVLNSASVRCAGHLPEVQGVHRRGVVSTTQSPTRVECLWDPGGVPFCDSIALTPPAPPRWSATRRSPPRTSSPSRRSSRCGRTSQFRRSEKRSEQRNAQKRPSPPTLHSALSSASRHRVTIRRSQTRPASVSARPTAGCRPSTSCRSARWGTEAARAPKSTAFARRAPPSPARAVSTTQPPARRPWTRVEYTLSIASALTPPDPPFSDAKGRIGKRICLEVRRAVWSHFSGSDSNSNTLTHPAREKPLQTLNDEWVSVPTNSLDAASEVSFKHVSRNKVRRGLQPRHPYGESLMQRATAYSRDIPIENPYCSEPRPTAAIPMESPYCGCTLTRVRPCSTRRRSSSARTSATSSTC